MFKSKEIKVHKIGNFVVVMTESEKWEGLVESLDMFSSDFMSEGRC